MRFGTNTALSDALNGAGESDDACAPRRILEARLICARCISFVRFGEPPMDSDETLRDTSLKPRVPRAE